jgi:CheY-like chemotaxis protein
MTLMGSPVETVRGAGRAPTLPRVAAEDARAARPKVLIVDDNVVNQKVGAFLVEKRGYGADVVGSGQEAVEAVLGRSYAAVLMDCQMPRFDGYAATALIRQREAAGVHTPIIALTANTGPGARERCMEAGMDDYLSKPIVAEALDQALRRWCPIPATRGPATVRGLRLGSDVRAAESIRPPEGPRETPRPAEVSGPSEAPRSSRYSTGRTPAPTVVQELARRSASPIDREAIAKLRQVQREGEPDVVAEVASLFLSDAPTRIASLRRAIDAADAPALERTAHALRGSAGHLGARGMQALCASLEEQARRGATVSASELVKALEEELERVRAALVREVTGGAEARIGRGSP